MHLFLSLALILAPLMPADIKPTMIYLGAGVEPIHTMKLRLGEVMPHDGIILTYTNFIRIKSALEGAPDLCVWAIDEAVQRCQIGAEEQERILLNREEKDQEILAAYEARLLKVESDLTKETQRSQILERTSIILGISAELRPSFIIVDRL